MKPYHGHCRSLHGVAGGEEAGGSGLSSCPQEVKHCDDDDGNLAIMEIFVWVWPAACVYV